MSNTFYEELQKLLEENSSNEDTCCITMSPLEEDCVILECGHKFNYNALYKEVCQQKYVFRTYSFYSLKQNIIDHILKNDYNYFIRCPYCRNIQYSLIPTKEGYQQRYGINSLEIENEDVPFLLTNRIKGCAIHNGRVFKQHTDDKKCHFEGCSSLSLTHFSNIKKYYCLEHTYCGIIFNKEFEREKKQKEKEEVKRQKLKEKKDAQKKKEEEKWKMKQEQIKVKEEGQKLKEEEKKMKAEQKQKQKEEKEEKKKNKLQEKQKEKQEGLKIKS